MAKYLLLKHYRGAPAAVNDVPMDQWTPEEVSAHVRYMRDFAARLEDTGEFVDGQALSPQGTFVRYDGEGRPPVSRGALRTARDLTASRTPVRGCQPCRTTDAASQGGQAKANASPPPKFISQFRL